MTLIRYSTIAAFALLSASFGFADPIAVDVYPSVAPNIYGSPSFDGYWSNEYTALASGLSSYGDPILPTYYAQQSTIPGSDLLTTSFYSWKGQADPGAAFGPQFAKELGNRPSFGIVIDGNGERFSISELSFSATSDDPGNILGFIRARGSYSYGPNYVGIIENPDGTRTLVTTGSDTLVDMVIGRGSGNALWPCAPPDSCSTVAEQQAALDSWAVYNGAPWHFTGTYTLSADDGALLAEGGARFTIDPVPEPAPFLLIGAGLLALAGGAKRVARRRLARQR